MPFFASSSTEMVRFCMPDVRIEILGIKTFCRNWPLGMVAVCISILEIRNRKNSENNMYVRLQYEQFQISTTYVPKKMCALFKNAKSELIRNIDKGFWNLEDSSGYFDTSKMLVRHFRLANEAHKCFLIYSNRSNIFWRSFLADLHK